MKRRQGCGRRCARGVTLIEQVTVVAILAVLVCVASPSLAGLVRRGRTQTAQMDLMEALGYARGEAVLRRTRVLLCPTLDRRHCSATNRWERGWLVGVDSDHDNQPDGAPLRVGEAYTSLVIQSSRVRRRVAFLPDGSAGGSNLTLLFCSPDGAGVTLGVVVANTGRARGSHPSARQAAECGRE